MGETGALVDALLDLSWTCCMIADCELQDDGSRWQDFEILSLKVSIGCLDEVTAGSDEIPFFLPLILDLDWIWSYESGSLRW